MCSIPINVLLFDGKKPTAPRAPDYTLLAKWNDTLIGKPSVKCGPRTTRSDQEGLLILFFKTSMYT
jgi:hypothetical protein